MKSRLCRFQIDSDLHVLDINSIARVVLAILDVPPANYLLQLLSPESAADIRERILRALPAPGPKRIRIQAISQPNPVFGREADELPIDIDIAADGCIHLQFDSDSLLSCSKPFWIDSTYLCGLLGLNALVCDGDGTVLAANFPGQGWHVRERPIRLADCVDHSACERVLELLQEQPTMDLTWAVPNVMFTPLTDSVFTGNLTLFPLWVDGRVGKVLIVFREHSRQQTDMHGNTISIASFIAGIEQKTEGIAILDDEGHFIYQNRAHCDMFGCRDQHDLMGQHWGVIYDEATRDLVANTAWVALQNEKRWQGTVRATRRDGTVFDQWISATRVPGVGIVGTSSDVTEQRRMADALQLSERQLSAVVGTAHDAIMTIDDDGRLLHWNISAERIFGYSATQMIGQSIERLLPQGNDTAAITIRQLLLAAPGTVVATHPIETTLRSASGERIAVEASLSDWRTPDRHYRTLIVRDIRDRLRQVQQLVTAHDQLTRMKTQKQVYGEIIEFASGIMAIGSDRMSEVLMSFYDSARLSYCALYHIVDDGERHLECIADVGDPSSGPVALRHLVMTDADIAEMKAHRRSPYKPGHASGLVQKLRRKSARTAYFDLLDTVGNNAHYLLWCETDRAGIDERSVLMLELSTLKLSACLENYARIEAAARRSALENIGQVAASLVHENNHLASIVSSNLQLLQSQPDSPESQELIDDIQVAMKQHQVLFSRLLGAARMDSYADELIDPDEIVTRSIKLLRSSMPNSILLAVERHEQDCLLHVDAAMLGSALFNILINAYHACGAQGTISVATKAHGMWLDVQVRDTGCGMPPEVLRRVTDPFYTTKRGGRGSGLGLFMVKNFCTQSGGDLLIESQPGKGTLVIMRLPIAADSEDVIPVSVPSH